MNFGHNGEQLGLVLQRIRDNPEVWDDDHSSHVAPTLLVTVLNVQACPSNALLKGVTSSYPEVPHVDQDLSSPVACVWDTQKA